MAVSVPSYLIALPQPPPWKLGASQRPSSLRGHWAWRVKESSRQTEKSRCLGAAAVYKIGDGGGTGGPGESGGGAGKEGNDPNVTKRDATSVRLSYD